MTNTASLSASSITASSMANDLVMAQYREDFPVLQQQVHGKPLVYLDNAATTQKPQVVIDAISHYYQRDNANVHRGVHALAERATKDFEAARETVRGFLNAATLSELVFVRGTTEAINLVAQSYVRPLLKAGDEILITHIEHHANIVPWQMVAAQTGAKVVFAPVNDAAELIYDEWLALINERTRFIAVGHVSNAFGSINPVEKMIAAAKEQGIPVLVDGAQAVPHAEVDVQALAADFYAFSGHKVYGPTGIGVLYGREALLEEMQPYHGGGEMIHQVSTTGFQVNSLPHKFEAGTPNIAGSIGLAAALNYVASIGLAKIAAHEQNLLAYATEQVKQVPGLRLLGTAQHKAGILSFLMDDVHAHDLGTIVDNEGVAIRAGHHCAMPAMTRFGVAATARASFGLYNNEADIDALVASLIKAQEMFSV